MISTTSSAFIRIRNLSKSYLEGDKQHLVLRDVNAEILRGESVALLGRSGSGKSTLLNLISGIDMPDSGEVEIDGRSVTSMTERDRTLFRRQHIGFIYQFFNLIPTLTVGENIRLVLDLNKVGAEDTVSRCNALLEAVGLDGRQSSYPDSLSGGEQQRVAIARALVHRPAVVLADEPTGNLDEATANNVWQLLEDLVRSTGGTLLLATHSVAAARRCDRVIELVDGKLIAHTDSLE